MEILGLFASAFLAASFFPFQSELLFIALLKANNYPDILLLTAASIGNTCGSVLNWWLGRSIARYGNRRWFPISQKTLHKAEGWFVRWGKWSLLLSWVPIIGDPLTMIAGVLRTRFLPFILIVGIAKTARYCAIMWMM